MKPSLFGYLGASALLISLVPGWTSAQVVDFATCDQNLVACDTNTTSCCYRNFDSVGGDKAIIIPLDRCHQRIASSGKLGPPSNASPQWCQDSPSSVDNGVFEVYGLVYRLMQVGIPVHWAINPTKDPPALTNSQNANSQTYIERDIDMWVLNPRTTSPPELGNALVSCSGSCVDPVKRLNAKTLAPVDDSYNATAFPVRGGVFIIAPEDRPRFKQFWTKTGDFSRLYGNPFYDFSAVDLYEIQTGATLAYQDFRTSGPSYKVLHPNSAPVAMSLDYKPPRLARLSPAGVSEIWLNLAKLRQPAGPGCKNGVFSPEDAVFCDITESDIQAGQLVNGKFIWAWIDNWSDNSPCGNSAEITQHEKLDQFLTAQPGVRPGGHVMLMEAAVGVVEGCANRQLMGLQNAGIGLAALNNAPTEPLILRRANNLFMQWGDVPTEFSTGAVTRWTYYGNGANGYDPAHTGSTGTLARLVSEDQSGVNNTICTNHKSTAACDVFDARADADTIDVAAYLRHKNEPANGVIFYMGGNQINNAPSQLRMVLNAFISLPIATVPQAPNEVITEVSRSAPIVTDFLGVDTHYQGTYEHVDPPRPVQTYDGTVSDATFQFPYVLGHLRATDSSLVGTTETQFDQLGAAIFDVANGIPPAVPSGCGTPFGASCRTVFTNDPSSATPYQPVFFNTTEVAYLGPLMAPSMTVAEQSTLISRVLAGYENQHGVYEPKLGGVDRSTLALIEPSSVLGGTRPTMIYFGALDGMLHAVCAEPMTGTGCAAAGQELWAFLPRKQLPLLRSNTQRIDGSPKVADVFGDWGGSGTRTWKTVLTFQTGKGDPGFPNQAPAVYALDISDPFNPSILWEVTTPVDGIKRGAFDLGVGLNLAMGSVRNGSHVVNLTFVHTNNGGTGDPGNYLAAIDTVTGKIVWIQSQAYPVPRTTYPVSAPQLPPYPPVPATGIPGGVAAIDLLGVNAITHIVVPSLYGELYLVDALNGKNAFGSGPLFQFQYNFQPIGAPPTLYIDRTSGKPHAVIVSGGYADPVNSSWAPAWVEQWAVSVALRPSGPLPIHEHTGGADNPFSINLGAGNRAFSQAVVSGNELFVVTDNGDVNAANYGTGGTSTGRLHRLSLDKRGIGSSGGGHTIGGGASPVDATGGIIHVGSASTVKKLDFTSNFDAAGVSMELVFDAKSGKQVWLRLH